MQQPFRILITLGCILYAVNCQSQRNPLLSAYDNKAYNAGDQNWAITEDCNGRMIVANTGGVIIFNGMKWTFLSIGNGKIVRSVFTDKNCNVYVGGFGYFGRIDFTNPYNPGYIPIDEKILSESRQEIWSIYEFKDEIILQSFSEIFVYKDGKISNKIPPNNILMGISKNNKLLFPAIPKGVLEYNKQFLIFKDQNQFPEGIQNTAIEILAEGQVLIGTKNHGLYLINDKIQKIKSPIMSEIADHEINRILVTKSDLIIIGTISNGIYILDKSFRLVYHSNKSSGLYNNTVLSLYEDSIGDIWVGMDKGINVIHLGSHSLTRHDDIAGNLGTIYAYELFNNQIFIGTNQGAFMSLDGKVFVPVRNVQGHVWSFLKMENELLCSHNNGTYIIDNKVGKLISGNTGGWAMQKLSNNRLMLSSYTGLVMLQKKEGKWEHTPITDHRIAFETFNINGRYLLGFSKNQGISLLKFDNDYTSCKKMLINHPVVEKPMPFIASGKNCFYLPTSDGKTLRYDIDSKKWTTITSDNLPGDMNISNKYVVIPSKNLQLKHLLELYAQKYKLGIILSDANGFTEHIINKSTYTFPKVECIMSTHNTIVSGFEYPIKLGSTTKNIAIQLSKNKPHFDVEYYYKIEYKGDKTNEWNPVPQNGEIRLLNPQNGTFSLWVKNQNNETLQLLTFYLPAKWYKNYQGLLLYSFLLMTISFGIIQRNKKRHEVERKKMEQEHDEAIARARIMFEKNELEKEVIFKSKQLANSAITLIHKNEMLSSIQNIVKENIQGTIRQKIIKLIDKGLTSDNEWALFEENFNAVHEELFDKLKARLPEITSSEIRLAGYIKMDLMSKEIAPLMNISVRSVENKRYILRNKLNLPPEVSLQDYIKKL